MSDDIEDQIEKYKFMAEIAKEQYDSALKRNTMLDDKVAKLLTLISILILGYSALLSKLEFLKSIPYFWKSIWVLAMLLTFTALVGTWFLLFNTIILTIMHRLNMKDEELQATFAYKDRLTTYWHLVSVYADLTEEILEDLEPKVEKLQKSYDLLRVSASFCVFCLFYTAVLNLIY